MVHPYLTVRQKHSNVTKITNKSENVFFVLRLMIRSYMFRGRNFPIQRKKKYINVLLVKKNQVPWK